MTFSFSSLLQSVESFFGIAQAEPQVLQQSADAIIEAAKPAIDAISPGAAESAETHINATVSALVAKVQPYLQDVSQAEPLINGIVATLSSAAASTVKTAAPSTQTVAPAPASS